MRTTSTTFALAALTSLATAHFNLDYPSARGLDEDKLTNFPCGGQDTVSAQRTMWPMTGGQIALTMGHIESNVEVLLAMGNSPGAAFNTVLRPTFSEQGLGSFCMTGFTVPDGLKIMEGMNATIQVITNGDPDGGLYNCADITFSKMAMMASKDVCKNATKVTTKASSVKGSPNMTTSAMGSMSSGASGHEGHHDGHEGHNMNKTSSAVSIGSVGNAWIGGLVVAGTAAWAMVL
ncbi:uncharacterized protein RAG0_11624 [Rhynchosporium agropyri]|uniref:Copper acquisition factor BIM1-like domain-containing protein n=1 Tax=Rhynchosporium agropyri TaxID=914238 RepID=A0A1E1L523_9HELO|nr:uncharacterized protein RAG0_11624 [Rhynchosporium agropyri]